MIPGSDSGHGHSPPAHRYCCNVEMQESRDTNDFASLLFSPQDGGENSKKKRISFSCA